MLSENEIRSLNADKLEYFYAEGRAGKKDVTRWVRGKAGVPNRDRSREILTDDRGRPIDKPRRADFATDSAYARAFHAYKDRVAGVANASFDRSFSRAMRGRSKAKRDPNVDRLWKGLSRAGREYLNAYVSDFSESDVRAAAKRVPTKDWSAIHRLLGGQRPAYESASAYEP